MERETWLANRQRRINGFLARTCEPQLLLKRLYREWNAATLRGATLTGRLGRQFSVARVPLRQAQFRAFRFLYPNTAGTPVSVGSHGFSVLEVRPNGG
jgi:hypothetical protein